MEIQIKRAVKAGNSSAVILPKSWLNKDVKIELVKKTPEAILLDALEILKEHMDLKEIIGIYLAGSCAREEEDENSDIDILIITNNLDKGQIRKGAYNLLIISAKLLTRKLEEDLLPIGQMIRESRPLLNAHYISSIEIKVTRKNIKWHMDTTKEKLNLLKRLIHKTKRKYLPDRAMYTIILRIRTLHIIEKLIENKEYSKKGFIKIIESVSNGKEPYNSYLNIKNNLKERNKSSLKEAENLINYLENQMVRIEK